MTLKNKSASDWRNILSPEAYRVTREHGTERAFSHAGFPKTDGVYRCVCCGEKLFTQAGKFESGCGWPAFSAPAQGAPIAETHDTSFGMQRTEVHCDNCDAHLGHVFNDGPAPTGLRYCINGVALTFEPSENAEKTS